MDTTAELNMNAKTGVDEYRVKLTPQQGGVSSRKRLSDSRCSTRSINASFKSPAQKTDAVKSAVSLEEEARDLRKTLERLNSDIALLAKDGFVVQELDQHIELLHEYNDIKDIGQTLLGRLARLRGVTTRDLYSHFGLELDD